MTQSLNLLDPDGNEIELYVDDPAIDWQAEPATILSPVEPLDRQRWLVRCGACASSFSRMDGYPRLTSSRLNCNW